MAGGLEDFGGGIRRLLNLLDEQQEAIEYDLIVMGLRLDWLGTERLSWRDLHVIVQNLPRESALARAMHGKDVLWGLSEHLLAEAIDVLALANWQRSNAGKRTPGPKPKPIPRPGKSDGVQRIGAEPLPIAELDDWIAEAEAAAA